jgi:flagellar hook-basal body complex protein FliE
MIKSPSLPSLSVPATRADVGARGPAGAAGDVGGGTFTDALSAAVNAVSAQGTVAEQKAAELAQGQGNIHETALALEKADVSMRLLLKARNKVVEAYQELSRMPV